VAQKTEFQPNIWLTRVLAEM